MLANIYTGCKCGETWTVTAFDHIDIYRDKVYPGLMCSKCFSTKLTQKVTADGVPYMHELTHDEIMWEISKGNDDDDDYDSYNYTCSICGGEVCEDYSSCICDDFDNDIIITPRRANDFDDLPF